MGDTPPQPTRPVLPNEMEAALSIREYEQRTEALKIWITSQFSHVRELADLSADALQKALELQAVELARRLEELNHAHKIAMENWARSLPRELFETVIIDWNKWRDQVNAAMIEGRQQVVNTSNNSTRIDKLEDTFPKDSASRLATLEAEIASAKGALSLIRWVGVGGIVIALLSLLSYLRTVKVVP